MSGMEQAPRTPGKLQIIQVECGVCGDLLVRPGIKWEHSVPPDSDHAPEPRPRGTETVIPPV